MAVHQRDIVDANFRLPGGIFKPHPVLVISNDIIHECEESFIGVMISGTPEIDDFSFPLTNDMLTKPMKKSCQVRCHLISFFDKSDIVGARKSEMKITPFKDVLKKINSSVF
jgi:hypothetical protein